MLPDLEASPSLLRSQLQDTAKKSTEVAREGKKLAQPLDQRRNLYVLGIPQHISLEQFTDLFSDFGVVSHAVILAVLDAFSRRRGFVVMSSNEEASRAMKRMSGAVVQGYKLHVSWAVVQRSNGFLDGTDRTPYTGSQCLPPSVTPISTPSLPRIQSPHQQLSSASHSAPPSHLSVQTPILFLANLHPDVFQNSADVLPLLTPYGPVRSIKLVDMRPASSYGEKQLGDEFAQASATSYPLSDAPLGALIEYVHHADALMAKKALEGQVYGSISGPGLLALLILLKPDQDQDTPHMTVDKLFSTLQSEESGKNIWMSGNYTCSYCSESINSLDGLKLTAFSATVPQVEHSHCGGHTPRQDSLQPHTNNGSLLRTLHHSVPPPHSTAQRYFYSIPSSRTHSTYDSVQVDPFPRHHILSSTPLRASPLSTFTHSETPRLIMPSTYSSQRNSTHPLGVSQNPCAQTPGHNQFLSSASLDQN